MDSKNSPIEKRKLPTIDHGVDIIGDEWDEENEWNNEEINTEALQNGEDWEMEFEKRNDPTHPYCTNWPVNKRKEKKDEKV